MNKMFLCCVFALCQCTATFFPLLAAQGPQVLYGAKDTKEGFVAINIERSGFNLLDIKSLAQLPLYPNQKQSSASSWQHMPLLKMSSHSSSVSKKSSHQSSMAKSMDCSPLSSSTSEACIGSIPAILAQKQPASQSESKEVASILAELKTAEVKNNINMFDANKKQCFKDSNIDAVSVYLDEDSSQSQQSGGKVSRSRSKSARNMFSLKDAHAISVFLNSSDLTSSIHSSSHHSKTRPIQDLLAHPKQASLSDSGVSRPHTLLDQENQREIKHINLEKLMKDVQASSINIVPMAHEKDSNEEKNCFVNKNIKFDKSFNIGIKENTSQKNIARNIDTQTDVQEGIKAVRNEIVQSGTQTESVEHKAENTQTIPYTTTDSGTQTAIKSETKDSQTAIYSMDSIHTQTVSHPMHDSDVQTDVVFQQQNSSTKPDKDISVSIVSTQTDGQEVVKAVRNEIVQSGTQTESVEHKAENTQTIPYTTTDSGIQTAIKSETKDSQTDLISRNNAIYMTQDAAKEAQSSSQTNPWDMTVPYLAAFGNKVSAMWNDMVYFTSSKLKKTRKTLSKMIKRGQKHIEFWLKKMGAKSHRYHAEARKRRRKTFIAHNQRRHTVQWTLGNRKRFQDWNIA